MKNKLIVISILTFLFASCKNDVSSQYNSLPPENMNDGLNVGTLNEVNINPKLIEIAVNKISRGKYKEVHSILIFRDNKLVLEEYFQGHKYQWDAPSHYGELVTWDRSMMHCIHSVTKSFTSICIGIAIDKGFIKSVHESIFDYLLDYQQYKVDGKEKITIEHLLTMTSGLQWDEWNAPLSSPENDQIGIWFSDEGPIDFILERPLIYEPGTHFTYSGGNMEVLGEILGNATGMKINMFSANGWGGQKIIVIPELNTVIVFTGGNYISRVKQFKILENYVIPAIE